MDLVVTSLEAWDAVWRRNQHLVAGLLRQSPDLRVLFVEPSTDPLHDVRSRRTPRRGQGLRRGPSLGGISPDALWLLEPTKVLPRRLDPRADARWAAAVVRAAQRIGLVDTVLWVNDPLGAHLMGTLGDEGRSALYDITDDWTLADRTEVQTQRVVSLEDELLERVGEVVVCSSALAGTKGRRRDVTLIPNGVDTAAYRERRPRPGDLPPGRVCLYVGTLHEDRLDVELCMATAQALAPDESLVLVGPDRLQTAASAALTRSGVVILGARPSEAVPAYLGAADLLVVPHVITPFTDSLDPIKLYEYQAAGKPVVATRVAGFRDVKDELVHLADAADFPVVVARMVADSRHQGTEADRTSRPESSDWSVRVAQMADVLSRLAR